MRVALLLPLIYVAAVLQTSLGDVLRVGSVEPDLLAVLAVVWLLYVPGPRSFLAAGLVGMASDLIGPGRLGVAAASFLLVGFAVAHLRSRKAIKHVVAQTAVVWVAVTLIVAGMAAGRWLLGEAAASPSILLTRSLCVGVYSAGIAVPMLMVAGWMQEPFRRRSVVS